MSRKFLLCTVASAALLASPAFAADLPVKARPAPALAWSWAGFYIGGHGGYGWKENDFGRVVQVNPLVTLGDISSKGWVAGGQAGYNWQYGRWVAGLEVDGSATQIRGRSAPFIQNVGPGAVGTDFRSDDVQYLGTVRARLGGAVPFANTDVLLYGTAGLAWERLHRTETAIFTAPGIFQNVDTVIPRDHFGWVAGVGGEVRLGATNWIGRIEYLHYDFGTVEPTQAFASTFPPPISIADRGGRQTIDVVRAGLSYKFDSASSPLSAYAADMPVKAIAAPALAWSWAGYYIGGHGGYGWKQNDYYQVFSVNPLVTFGGIDSQGWVAGGQAGYNWQFGRWVAGLEMDGSATQIRGSATPLVRTFGPQTFTNTASDDVQYLGTVRARVGGAVPFANTDVLLYGTAGLAWERVNRDNGTINVVPAFTQFANTVTPRDHFGWVAGVGGEVRLGATNWIGRVEYLHYDFGTVEPATTVVSTAVGFVADRGGRQTIDVVRGGLSYKFNSASSPLSAYAADMPVKAMAPLAWSWAGFYLGGHGGYGWKQNDFADVVALTPLLTVGGIDSRGWVAGGQAGYNWQFGRWVAGFEVDGSATQIRGSSTPAVQNFGPGFSLTDTRSDDVQYLGTVRTRLGGAVPFASTDVLLYGTAGLAWERVNRTATTLTVIAPQSQLNTNVTPRDHFGWVAGVGGEVRLGATNWVGRVEYLHYDFGTVEQATAIVVNPAAGSFADKGGRQTIDVVRAGLSYKFAATP
jgi:outer membrane immunogenic protein